jgi:hypothetical protein
MSLLWGLFFNDLDITINISPLRGFDCMREINSTNIIPLWGFDCICGINSTNIISYGVSKSGIILINICSFK